eukprot:2320410-Heterocapsa_arctica.AAC.1
MIMTADMVELRNLGHSADDTPRRPQEFVVLVHESKATAIEGGFERQQRAQLLHDLQLPAEVVFGSLIADVDVALALPQNPVQQPHQHLQ